MAATDSMVVYAEKIAEQLGLEEPDYYDYEETKEFIEEYEDAYYDSIRGKD